MTEPDQAGPFATDGPGHGPRTCPPRACPATDRGRDGSAAPARTATSTGPEPDATHGRLRRPRIPERDRRPGCCRGSSRQPRPGRPPGRPSPSQATLRRRSGMSPATCSSSRARRHRPRRRRGGPETDAPGGGRDDDASVGQAMTSTSTSLPTELEPAADWATAWADLMGGHVSVHVRPVAGTTPEAAARAARQVLLRIGTWAGRLTRFDDTSELSRLNAAPDGHWSTSGRP